MKQSIGIVIDRARKFKRILVPAGELLFLILILFFSYLLRLDRIDGIYLPQITFLILTIIPVKLVLFWIFRLYHISFRYTSVHEVALVFKAVGISSLIFAFMSLILRDTLFFKGFPRSIIIIDFILTFIMSSGIRLAFRFFYFPQLKEKEGRKVLVVGAGRAGEQLVREMKISPISHYIPVAFIDDDPGKKKSIIHGIKVEGGSEKIPEVVSDFAVDDIIIAMPSASSIQLKKTMEYVRKSGNKNVKILPGMSHIITGEAKMGDVRAITVEDLLGREPVQIDMGHIAGQIKDKSVLVTGAAGSIGSELCRQIAGFQPSKLIMVDMGETELFYIDNEIRERFSALPVQAVIADVKDLFSMGSIFIKYSPQIVFHAAAYKHVPLMETNLREAVLNNIGGTRAVATLSIEHAIEKFIFISTDKAVNPTSIMGTTKRISENLLRCWGHNKCKFISVRFGNVLESRGSVVPIFKEQIRNGRPVTLTHPDMKRYLMSINEAVQLVLQASAMGAGGEVFVLDMGEPIKILDLAREMIRLSGLEPDKDIPIVITGTRPGEKLFEELLTAEEGTTATKHERIFVAKGIKVGPEYSQKVDTLMETAFGNFDREEIISMLQDLVPTYEPSADLRKQI
jgi:FlaA1/EpsC-like NDP-sugar epimerase